MDKLKGISNISKVVPEVYDDVLSQIEAQSDIQKQVDDNSTKTDTAYNKAVSADINAGHARDTAEAAMDGVSALDDVVDDLDRRVTALEEGGGGGGSTVTMVDNPVAGVDLTVNGTTKTLSKESDLDSYSTTAQMNTAIQNAIGNVDMLLGTGVIS